MGRGDERRREELLGLLGELPPRSRPIGAHRLWEEERDGYTLETLVLDLNGVEPVPAFFVRPTSGAGPWPSCSTTTRTATTTGWASGSCSWGARRCSSPRTRTS